MRPLCAFRSSASRLQVGSHAPRPPGLLARRRCETRLNFSWTKPAPRIGNLPDGTRKKMFRKAKPARLHGRLATCPTEIIAATGIPWR
jgi:hypothetical protein